MYLRQQKRGVVSATAERPSHHVRLRSRFGISVGVAVLLFASVGFAQPAPNMAILRRTAPLSAADRQNVQRWVDGLLEQLFTSQTVEADGAKFLAQWRENALAADATSDFKKALAQVIVDSLTKHIAAANPVQPLAIVFSLLALNELADPATLGVYRQALASTLPGVRLTAINGLLQMKLTAQQWTALLPDLQKAGEAETTSAVLDRLYRLLISDPAGQQVLPVVLKILDARFNAFEKKGVAPFAADVDIINWLGTRASVGANAPQRINLAQYMARLLADAVVPYSSTNVPAPRKEQLERVIMAAEQQLKVVATAVAANRSQPDVTRTLQEGGPDLVKKMNAELEKWIGSPTVPGFLNTPPFNFPVGLNIQRVAPTTSSAPASQPGR